MGLGSCLDGYGKFLLSSGIQPPDREAREGKGAPITGHEGPEGEQRYSPTLS